MLETTMDNFLLQALLDHDLGRYTQAAAALQALAASAPNAQERALRLRMAAADPEAPPDIDAIVERARLEASLELLTGVSGAALLALAAPRGQGATPSADRR